MRSSACCTASSWSIRRSSTQVGRSSDGALVISLLPESPVRGNVAHQKRRYALTAAVLIASGVEPEDTSWWKADDLWLYAFDAVVVFVRAASERRQLPIATICIALRDQT